jgi:hypothetical protein
VHVVQTAIACAKEGATLAHALREREQRGGGPSQRPRGGCRAASFPEAPWHQIQQHVSTTFSTRSHGNGQEVFLPIEEAWTFRPELEVVLILNVPPNEDAAFEKCAWVILEIPLVVLDEEASGVLRPTRP